MRRHLCRALNEAALLFLDWSWNGKAGIHATEALSAASALHSTTEMIVATAILIESALSAGDVERAELHIASLCELLNDRVPGRRSDAVLVRLQTRFPTITTVIPTRTH